MIEPEKIIAKLILDTRKDMIRWFGIWTADYQEYIYGHFKYSFNTIIPYRLGQPWEQINHKLTFKSIVVSEDEELLKSLLAEIDKQQREFKDLQTQQEEDELNNWLNPNGANQP